MGRVLLLNKPFGVICQFTAEAGQHSLKDFVDVPGVYPSGRLDADSEGLVVLTGDGALQAAISDPKHKLDKTYWVQVEGRPGQDEIRALQRGVSLRDGPTLPAKARIMDEPAIWPRHPPIRYRAAIPTTWLELTLREGRNRQVRRMTAAVGFPCLRLVRWRVGPWTLEGLDPGRWREVAVAHASELARTPRRNSG